ncbi:hypothetical protein [Acidaminococcus timonensis]|uniref:hypothetical protein n=1 Tax=Acidaminococcus timonensis TaxID=1871002 RepID=UPI0026EC1D1E|nr:hypothetical protein [Acidaminococcus timonensis]
MKKIQSQLVDNLHNTAKVMEAFANDYAKTKEKQEEILRFEVLYLTDRAKHLEEVARYLDAVADFQ